LGTGTVELKAPRIDDRRCDEQGGRQRFTSRILPPYMRRSPKVAEVLPILYLRGLSTGDFRPALEGLLGEDAAGLSPTNIARLTACWEQEYTAFRRRDLAGREYVYVWVDGVHFNIRLEDDRLCTLVMIGARPDGEKELLAVEDGYRESAESWKTLLRDLRRRGMAAPVVAVGETSSCNSCTVAAPGGGPGTTAAAGAGAAGAAVVATLGAQSGRRQTGAVENIAHSVGI
jgi:putative transposase